MNYTVIDGLQPDEPPKVGSQSVVTINILKNDDAHGVIQFKDTSKTIHEEDKRVVLMLERTGKSSFIETLTIRHHIRHHDYITFSTTT